MTRPCLVLDAMGVIFQAADDVGELLIPFIAEHDGTSDEAQVQSAYLAASLGEIDANSFWRQVGVSADRKQANSSFALLTLPEILEADFACTDRIYTLWC